MRSRSAGCAFGAIFGAKMETNAGARSGTGKINGSFILFERAPRRGDDQSLRGCSCQCLEHEALLDLLGGAGTSQSGAQHPRLLPESVGQFAREPRLLLKSAVPAFAPCSEAILLLWALCLLVPYDR